MGSKWPKNSKICPKTKIIGEILSRFFLAQALGTYTMTIWSGPQLSIARAWVRGAQKGPEWARNDQKLAKYVSKLELLVRYFQFFFLIQALGTYTMTIWSGPQLSTTRAWVRGAQNCPEWAQNDQKLSNNSSFGTHFPRHRTQIFPNWNSCLYWHLQFSWLVLDFWILSAMYK